MVQIDQKDQVDQIEQKVENYVRDMSELTYHSREEYDKKSRECRKVYKMVPKKTDIIKTYNKLVEEGSLKPNPTFYQYSLKKMGKSSSGVSVITVLTSPKPEYTNIKGEKVKQTFSCGCSCAYCPNEPEVRLNLQITELYNNTVHVLCSNDEDLKIIRIISYIIHKGKEYSSFKCSSFELNTFKITFDKNDTLDNFRIGDGVVGVKIEQPRSYLSTEPAVLRANANNFDCYEQFNDRAMTLLMCGHPIDKIEMIVLGGTWDHYPLEYQFEYVRDIYYSANVFSEPVKRERYSLTKEIEINENAKHRIIGLTIETRPDCITLNQIKKLREMNVTRVQIGVQHIDNDVLTIIERGCTVEDTIKGTRLLKDNGYKVDWHLMPDLPGSSYEKDMEMFKSILTNKTMNTSGNHSVHKLLSPDKQPDQLKIYPCTTVDFTLIKEWYDQGIYKPYSEDEEKLIEVIKYIKTNMYPWIRLNRIIRDIPNINILGGNTNVNLRQKVLKQMSEEGLHCNCIRCREIKGKNDTDLSKAELFIDEYNDVGATEYFLSYCSPCKKDLYGFLRLRIIDNNDNTVYKEFSEHAFIRELHVYGLLVKHNNKTNDESFQHKGIGSRLLCEAEKICSYKGITDVAIISGVGVRGFYQKKGYTLKNNYMVKRLEQPIDIYFDVFIWCICISIVIIIWY